MEEDHDGKKENEGLLWEIDGATFGTRMLYTHVCALTVIVKE